MHGQNEQEVRAGVAGRHNNKMKICQALNREITPQECAAAQRPRNGLPKKFCEGCDWFSKSFEELSEKKPRPQRADGYVPSKYTVYISKKLLPILLKKSKENNMIPAVYIAKILAKDLFKDD